MGIVKKPSFIAVLLSYSQCSRSLKLLQAGGDGLYEARENQSVHLVEDQKP
jgi:hypothetical protein